MPQRAAVRRVAQKRNGAGELLGTQPLIAGDAEACQVEGGAVPRRRVDRSGPGLVREVGGRRLALARVDQLGAVLRLVRLEWDGRRSPLRVRRMTSKQFSDQQGFVRRSWEAEMPLSYIFFLFVCFYLSVYLVIRF